MLRKSSLWLALGIACALATPAVAQNTPGQRITGTMRMTHRAYRVPRDHRMTLYGAVKGIPTGTQFTLAVPRKGDYMVDAGRAKFRMNGRFTSGSNLKSGEFAHVTGMVNGMNVRATDVDIRYKRPAAHHVMRGRMGTAPRK